MSQQTNPTLDKREGCVSFCSATPRRPTYSGVWGEWAANLAEGSPWPGEIVAGSPGESDSDSLRMLSGETTALRRHSTYNYVSDYDRTQRAPGCGMRGGSALAVVGFARRGGRRARRSGPRRVWYEKRVACISLPLCTLFVLYSILADQAGADRHFPPRQFRIV